MVEVASLTPSWSDVADRRDVDVPQQSMPVLTIGTDSWWRGVGVPNAPPTDYTSDATSEIPESLQDDLSFTSSARSSPSWHSSQLPSYTFPPTVRTESVRTPHDPVHTPGELVRTLDEPRRIADNLNPPPNNSVSQVGDTVGSTRSIRPPVSVGPHDPVHTPGELVRTLDEPRRIADNLNPPPNNSVSQVGDTVGSTRSERPPVSVDPPTPPGPLRVMLYGMTEQGALIKLRDIDAGGSAPLYLLGDVKALDSRIQTHGCGEKVVLLILAIFGIGSSGKTFFVNQAFGTDFTEGHNRTTKGANAGFCKYTTACGNTFLVLILDIEGMDSSEAHRAEIQQPDTFAVTSLLFAYLTSDALFFNVKFDNLGNHKASGLEALGRLFDYILDAASKHPTVKPPKRRLVYVIRDFRDAADPHIRPGNGRTRKDVEVQCADLMNDLWSERNGPGDKKSKDRFGDYFNLEVFYVIDPTYRMREFQRDVDEQMDDLLLRVEKDGPRAPQELGTHISTSWSHANSEAKLLPSLNIEYLLQKELCEKFKNDFIDRHMKDTAVKVAVGKTWKETDEPIKKQLVTVRDDWELTFRKKFPGGRDVNEHYWEVFDMESVMRGRFIEHLKQKFLAEKDLALRGDLDRSVAALEAEKTAISNELVVNNYSRPWATSLQVVTGESYEQCQARFVEERRQKVRDETASIIQKRFKAAQRKIHESDVALEKEIRAAADSFVGINGNAAKRDKLLSDNQKEHNAVVRVWRTAFPDRFKQFRSDPDGWRMKAPDANEPQDLHPSMEQWDGKFRNFQQEVKKREEERWRDQKRRSFWDPLSTSAKNGVQNGFLYGGAAGLVGGALGGIGIGAASVATGGWAAAPVGLAYFVGWTLGGTGLGLTAGTATGGATGTAAGFARGSFGWCTHEAFVAPMCD